MPEDKDKYNKPRKKIPNYKREPGKLPTFEIDPNSGKVLPEALEAAERYRKIKNKSEIDPNSEIVLPEKLIKAAERYRKIKNKSSDFPMSKEGSPTVTDTETGETTFGRPRKFNSGSKLKDLIGPITVRPSGTQETTVEGKVKRDTKAGSVGVGTKFGNITLSKSNVTESMPGYSDYKTKSKGISYDNSFDIGKSSKLDFNLRKGKSESSFGDSKTEGATVTFTKTFGGPKMKTGGMCRGMGKAVKGGKFTGVK
jgi:hypothetical protein